MQSLEMNLSKLPEHIREPVNRYIRFGSPVGCFLSSIISNNLKMSFIYADNINCEKMLDIVGFFYNEAPSACWGSEEKMKRWIDMGGYENYSKSKIEGR